MLKELPVVGEGAGRAKGRNGDMERGWGLEGTMSCCPEQRSCLINPDGPKQGRGEQQPGRICRSIGEFYYPLHGFLYFLDFL